MPRSVCRVPSDVLMVDWLADVPSADVFRFVPALAVNEVFPIVPPAWNGDPSVVFIVDKAVLPVPCNAAVAAPFNVPKLNVGVAPKAGSVTPEPNPMKTGLPVTPKAAPVVSYRIIFEKQTVLISKHPIVLPVPGVTATLSAA